MVCEREISLELKAMLVAVSSLSPVNIHTYRKGSRHVYTVSKTYITSEKKCGEEKGVENAYTLIPAFLSSSSVGLTFSYRWKRQ